VSDVWSRIGEAAERYAEAFDAGDLPTPPAQRLVVVTCMDARIDPVQLFGLSLGDAHVLRNAGAVVTDDVLRSVAVSTQLLGTRKVALMAHTRCGMAGITNDDVRASFAAAGVDASDVDFQPFPDLEESVRAGMARLSASPLLPEDVDVHGWIYDVETGRVSEVGA